MKNVYINPIDYYVKAILEQNKIEFEAQMEEITSKKINKMQEKIKKQKKLLKEKDKEIERLNNIIKELDIEANKNIQVCNNRGFNLISNIDEVKSLDDFTFNEYICYLVSLEILDKLQELKGVISNE